jgi:hypothetical protein
MKTQVEKITPQMASDILESRNPHNRNVSESTVQAYANDMKNGRWSLTHQGIAFDENNNLIDGQHRLWAIVFANVTVELMVTTGVPIQEVKNGVVLKPMDVIDGGKVRSTGQKMSLSHGIKNGNQVAAAVRGIISILDPLLRWKKTSTANSLFVYELYGENIEAVLGHLDGRKRVSHIAGPLALYHKAEPEKAIEFCKQISTLENLSSGARAFLKFLESKHNSSDTPTSLRAAGVFLKAYHEGRDIKNFVDSDIGLKFLNQFYPQLNDKIRKAVKPLPGGLSFKKKAMKV